MNAWLRRNLVPIALVVMASIVVIVGFELIASTASSTPIGAAEAESESLTVAGLIKVSLFLLVPGLITVAVRRRLARDRGNSSLREMQ